MESNMKSLSKALDILQLFLDYKKEMGLTEISNLSGIKKSTASRIIATLKKRGYLQQREKKGDYSPGVIYLNFAAFIKSKLKIRTIAAPYLLKLSERVGESVILSTGDNIEYIFSETFNGTRSASYALRVLPEEKIIKPTYRTPIGKLFLAEMSGDQLDSYLTKELSINQKAIDIGDINKALDTVKQQNLAYDDEQEVIGIRGVSSGIKNSEGKLVGCITIVAPSVRLTREGMSKLAPIVKHCALEISKELGFRE